MSHLKPLFKWSGGKSDEIKLFEKYIPEEYNLYIEPFVGGGSLYFYLNPKKAVINDIHPEVYDFYNNIKKGNILKIYDFLTNHSNTEEEYYKVRDKLNITDDLINASRFYYLRKTCFRGMIRYNKDGHFNIPYGKYKTYNYDILKNNEYEELLKRTKIYNKDYKEIFKKYNNENYFMFLDPPYDSTFSNYGFCDFNQDEQEKLYNCFINTKCKCLMIIGKTEYIENLYNDYIVDEYDKKYKFKLYNKRIDNNINNKHLIIKNF